MPISKPLSGRHLTHNGKQTDHKYIAPLLGYDLLLGRFTFQIQLGAYLYSPYKRRDPVFQHYVLSYYLYKSLYQYRPEGSPVYG